MHKEVLTNQQIALLPLIKAFSKEYYLVGGTAIALHIGHRRSIDYDLFSDEDIRREYIKNTINKKGFAIERLLYEEHNQLHIVVNSVKITFYKYPYKIAHPITYSDVITIPNLLDLSAMKAYALGGRAKWKDYVDLYFILKYYYNVKKISKRALIIYKTSFNEKLFREQLSYFKDIDYSESIEYMKKEIAGEEIKEFLTNTALTPF